MPGPGFSVAEFSAVLVWPYDLPTTFFCGKMFVSELLSFCASGVFYKKLSFSNIKLEKFGLQS